jgi:acetolactate synthase-1/2/3 large subunit
MNVSEILVEFSVRLGARRAFALTGGMAMYLNKAMHDHPDLSVVYMHHEQAVVSAAEGYTKAKNFEVIGLACITSGPGVANSINGLLSAFLDSAPILILAGQNKTSDISRTKIRSTGIQEIPSKSLITPVVKKFIRISAENLFLQLCEIRSELLSGRPGPVFVEIPLEQQSVEIQDPLTMLDSVFAHDILVSNSLHPDKIEDIRHLIGISKNIVVMLGNGLRISGLDTSRFIHILDSLDIPRLYTLLTLDLEDFFSPLNLGSPGGLAAISANNTLNSADLVIFVGARLDFGTTAYQTDLFGNRVNRIIIDVDFLELEKFTGQKNTYVLEYDLRIGLDWLTDIINETRSDIQKNLQWEWANSLKTLKNNYLTEEDLQLSTDALNIRNFSQAVSEIAATGFLVPASSGTATELFHRFLRLNGRVRSFIGSALGSMGHGLPQGIGALMARDDESLPVWVLEADGGLWMTSQELATVAGLRPKNFHIFVMNNQGYGSIANSQEKHLLYEAGTSPENGVYLPKWVDVAALFNFEYHKITTLPELKELLSTLNEKVEICLIDVVLPRNENRGPALSTMMVDGRPVTQNISELSW